MNSKKNLGRPYNGADIGLVVISPADDERVS